MRADAIYDTDILFRIRHLLALKTFAGQSPSIRTALEEAASEIEQLRQFAPAPHPDGHDL